jgi:hypothetical protein
VSKETANRCFDELASGLASGSISRGRALRLMGAALVGGALASLGIGGVAAADEECKPLNKKCNKDAQCCSGNCEGGMCAPAAPPECQEDGDCQANQCQQATCNNGVCVVENVPNGTPCNADNNACTADVCTDGVCVAGEDVC